MYQCDILGRKSRPDEFSKSAWTEAFQSMMLHGFRHLLADSKAQTCFYDTASLQKIADLPVFRVMEASISNDCRIDTG
jgi:hypothetical protein